MGAQSREILGHNFTISKFFGSDDGFYVVPDFQREFVWETEHVERLLRDVQDERQSDDGTAEYFIGSTVVCRNDDGVWAVIDGQQRLTTCFVTLCAIRDLLKAAGERIDSLDDLINKFRFNSGTLRDESRLRLELQYRDSQGVLAMIAHGSLSDEMRNAPPTKSVARLIDAYDAARAFLLEVAGQDSSELKKFFGYFIQRVKLVRIETPDLSRALSVFETVNDRGVGLNSMDLLKNLMFLRANEEQHGVLKEKWSELVRTIEGCREKPLRFLRYYLLSRFAGLPDSTRSIDPNKGLREEDVYRWFREHEDATGIIDDPLGFVDDLLSAARAYAMFAGGKDHLGHLVPFLGNISRLSNKATLHFILLLAARHLDRESFVELARQIENVYFCFLITREQSKVFERAFAKWSRDIASVHSREDLNRFIDERVRPELADRSRRFRLALLELAEGRIQRYRLRYVLAKLSQYVDAEAWGNPPYETLDGYLGQEIEHVLPQSGAKALPIFDRPEKYYEYVPMLGNLVLLEKSLNASKNDSPPAGKTPIYSQSKMFLTRCVFASEPVGKNTRPDRVAASLGGTSEWTSTAIESRQRLLARMAHQVWGVPEPSGDVPGETANVSAGP